MRANSLLLVLGASLMTVGACQTKAQTGAAAGAGVGAAVGRGLGGNFGMLVGAVAGGALGYEVGRSADEYDRRQMAYALEANRPIEWRNQETGHEYRVVPIDTRYEAGRECREFRMLADVEGQAEQLHGTACRAPDGSWQVIST